MLKLKKGFAVLVIVLLFLILLGTITLGYYYFNSEKTINKQQLYKNDYLYLDIVKLDKGTGVLYYEKQYFKIDLNNNKKILLSIPDNGYIVGWNMFFDRFFKSTAEDKFENCQIEDKNYLCLKDFNELKILFKSTYKKDDKEIFSLEKRAVYVLNESKDKLELLSSSDATQEHINGLFNDNDNQLYLHNQKDIDYLAQYGTNFQKETINIFLESINNNDYIKPVAIKIKDSCIKYPAEGKTTAICENLGEANINPLIKTVIKAKEGNYEVYLEFYKNGTKLDIPIYYFPSFIDSNIDWFVLYIYFIDENNIYISDGGGFEGYPSHYFFNGEIWEKLNLWLLINNDFPDDLQPPFSISVSPEYLKITEENYCCDIVYTNTEERENYRMVYTLNRFSKEIVNSFKINRKP